MLNIVNEKYDAELAWLASHNGKQVKTGGITLSKEHCPVDLATGRRVYKSGSFVGVLIPVARGLWGNYRRTGGQFAQLVTDAAVANAGLVWTARVAGTGGNAITIQKVDPGANSQALSVTVAGNAISVNLATSGTGLITSTAADVLGAVRANAAASALVHVELERGHNGTGLVTGDLAAGSLTGGAAAVGQQATLATGVEGNNNAITWTAREVGVVNIGVTLTNPGANNAPLSVVVSGAGTVASPYAINVTIATDGTGALTSTALEVMHAVRANAMANSLVSVASTGASTGAGVIVAAGNAALTGGADFPVSMANGQFGILMQDVDVTDGNSTGAILIGGRVLDGRLPAASDAYVRAALPMVNFSVENAP